MGEYVYIEYEQLGHGEDSDIVVVRLNRPDKLNAINTAMAAEFAEAFQRFADGNAFVAIVTGVGRSFTAGMDVKENVAAGHVTMQTPKIGDLFNPFFPGQKTDYTLPSIMPGHTRRLDKLVIAAVNGYAFGGGFYMAMASDICIAAESATFELSEVPLGMPVGWEVGYLNGLPRHVAMELALGGRLTAQRAAAAGLINRVVPDDELLSSAIEWAEKLCDLPRAVLTANRSLVDALIPMVPPDVRAAAEEHKARIYASPESGERLRKFVEKR